MLNLLSAESISESSLVNISRSRHAHGAKSSSNKGANVKTPKFVIKDPGWPNTYRNETVHLMDLYQISPEKYKWAVKIMQDQVEAKAPELKPNFVATGKIGSNFVANLTEFTYDESKNEL